MQTGLEGHHDVERLLMEREAEVNAPRGDSRNALIVASKNGHCDAVRLLLERGAETNAAKQHGTSSLMVASENGHCDVARLLLEKEVEVNAADDNGYTALMLASQNGHSGILRLLLGMEAEVNAARQNGWTSLMAASRNGHCDVVRLLLEMGAEVNAAKQDGTSALMVASQNGHYDVVRLLLERGSEVNAADEDGYTALMLASQNGHCSVLRLLLQRGAEVNAAKDDGTNALMVASQNGHSGIRRLLLESGAEVNAARQNGWTSLMAASRNGRCDVVRLLLERGAEVNAKKQDGTSAFMAGSQRGHYDVVSILLEREVEVNAADEDGYTALMLASQNGHCDVVRLLLERGAEVNAARQNGWTSLMAASMKGHFDVVRLLLERKAEVNAAKQNGWTSLMAASMKGHCDVATLLLQMGAGVNAAKQDGTSALMVASQNGHCGILILLLERGAEVNAAKQNGWTALMAASRHGHCAVVRLLLKSGAKVNAVRKDRTSALIVASTMGHCDVVRLLLKNAAYVNHWRQDGFNALMLASRNGHSDVVRLLLEGKAKVDIGGYVGCSTILLKVFSVLSLQIRLLLLLAFLCAFIDIRVTGCILLYLFFRAFMKICAEWTLYPDCETTALIQASKNGHCDVVRLLLEKEAEVNASVKEDGTALIQASKNGHCDVVKLLLEREAKVNASIGMFGSTSLILACQTGQWNIANLLIDAGADVSQVDRYGESAAVYITLCIINKKYDTQLGEGTKHIWKNPMAPKSHYAMSVASSALTAALRFNTTSEWFDCHFAKSALHEDILYGFLPLHFFRNYKELDKYLFGPYHGLEGKICLHTLGSAVVCKVPTTALQWLTIHHRDKLVNMLGQTPLHLLALENQLLDDMEDKIRLLTETLGFSFSDRDNNGRVPYHIACLCLNAQFLLCGLRFDSNFRMDMLAQDHLGKIPLEYLTYLVYNTTDVSGMPLLKLLSARETLSVLSQSMGLDSATQLKACTSPSLSDNTAGSVRRCSRTNVTIVELFEMTKEQKKVFFGIDDVSSLFKCSTRGVVNLSDKQHVIIAVIGLLELIGTEMGRLNPLFECVPELKGSVLEYTKCRELDEVDMSMKLVNFRDYFSTHLFKKRNRIHAAIRPKCYLKGICGQICSPYWTDARIKLECFHSVEFCADFWQILLKALDTKATRAYTKSNCFIIENCKRKHGFVGMLNLSWKVGDRIQLISVDIAPSIVSGYLDGYTALLRPRYYDNKEVGNKYWKGLELSSSHKDWDFLRFLHPEVMCAYALVKILRSLTGTFQTEKGMVYTAEEILPSYMVKSSLLWILDPEGKRSKIYKDLIINSVFHSESSSTYKDDVLDLCQELLRDAQVSGLFSKDVEMLLHIREKCTTGAGCPTVNERIFPYVLATRCSDRQQQNGIDVQWMQENWNLNVGVTSGQDEMIGSKTFYKDPESERVWIDHTFENNPVGQLSHHKIAFPDISEETARKCRVWALRMLRLLPHLLQYNSCTAHGEEITGIRNYYLPDQEISARDTDATVALCRVLEAVLE